MPFYAFSDAFTTPLRNVDFHMMKEMGLPESKNIPSRVSNTRDGKGIIFVGYNGDVNV